jgi:hypothetical protein
MSQSVKFAKVLTCSALIVLLTVPLRVAMMADAGSTRVFLDPPSQTVGAIGDSFTVNVSIADVSNICGYELKLYYNSTVMNGTAPLIEGSFLKSGGTTVFWPVRFTDHYNDSTHGVVWIDCTRWPASGVNGSGVLFTIKFKSLTSGDSVPLHLTDLALSDPNSSPIPCEVSDGVITVVPEFTSTVAVLSLLIGSLFGILFRKRAMRKVPNLNS